MVKQRWGISVNALARVGSSLLKLIIDKGRILENIEKAAYALGRNVSGPMYVKKLKIKEKDARAVAKIINYTDDLYGTQGEWVELTPNRAVKHEKICLMAKELYPTPEACTRIMKTHMQGICASIDPRLKFLMPGKCLAKKDEICEFVIELN